MYDVTFQDYQLQNPQNFDSWGDYPGDGPPDLPLDGGLPPSGPPVPWQAVLDDLAAFFDDMGDGISAPTGSDQHSSYDPAVDTSPFEPMFRGMFGSLPTVRDNPGYHYFDYLIQDIDPEFELTGYNATQFTANYSHGSILLSAMGSGIVAMTLNGITVYGQWHQGNATSTGPNDLVVNGGHWHFAYTGWDPDHYGGSPPPLPADDPASTPAPADPVAAAEQHRQSLSAALHGVLDRNGGHYTVPFSGPNGTQGSFDLAEFLNILDRYSLVSSTQDFKTFSGGAGFIEQLADGSYRTTMNIDYLRGYAATQGGLDYIMLHEPAHRLTIAMSFTHAVYSAYMAMGGTDALYRGTNGFNGAPALWMSESYVNNIVRALEALLPDVTEYARPGGGYNYTGTHGGP